MRSLVIWSVLLINLTGITLGEEPTRSETAAATQRDDARGKPRVSLKEIAVDLGGGVKLEMVLIPAGEFSMGSPNSDKDAVRNEQPQHRVRITKSFYLGKFVVTQDQWKAVLGGNPSYNKGPKNPVEAVSWEDCQLFLRVLNAKAATRSRRFILPSEAQWEYACRGGTTTKYSFGEDEKRLGEYAWDRQNCGGKTHPVGEKKPNAWGLFDMQGNVWQWCQDRYDEGYYAVSPKDDPTGPNNGARRVTRGSSWYGCGAFAARSACRGGFVTEQPDNFVGFRVAFVPADENKLASDGGRIEVEQRDE